MIEATGWIEEAARLWGSVYLHDLARTHDGTCHRHGADAMKKFDTLPGVRGLFELRSVVGGLTDEIAAGLRSFPVRNHIVYYRPEPGHVLIARILHGSRDRAAAVKPRGDE